MFTFLISISIPIVCLLILQFCILFKIPKFEKKMKEKQIDKIVFSTNKEDWKIFTNFVDHNKLFVILENIEDKKYVG